MNAELVDKIIAFFNSLIKGINELLIALGLKAIDIPVKEGEEDDDEL